VSYHYEYGNKHEVLRVPEQVLQVLQVLQITITAESDGDIS